MQAARFVVSGMVQGVYYRASTRQRALALGLVGHARNQADGSVDVVAAGSAAALDALEAWLWQGPPAATVAAVTRTVCAVLPTEDFVTG
ncbi:MULTISPECIES: acylphosphatase [Xanthomonas]|uniref:acylphosphatase n=1 Tax=Xanthomonas TaxID=338 RepID=UPI0006E719A5|nr:MULTISPECIES: acylphosphatase [Xanthomonas]MBO9747918.1 acylphosphatase [Xanthomonas phaseoli pv. dieffenbachiae]MBO9752072.1 acylphosphatase [Xanthomonas phaseoli pv. dieffenbachiae]MBO9877977.1 acylphosphatase [Xanthomonas sp. D-99]MBO9891530.1 acylphosphatase [Xanthomonas sp. D-36-1]OQP72612.1 acylphosphatase [Xanthomonas citri]